MVICQTCKDGIDPGLIKCPECGMINPDFGRTPAPSATSTVVSTSPPLNLPSSPSANLLGGVVLYADDATGVHEVDPRLGRFIPLNEGDALLLGTAAPPAEVQTAEGASIRVTAHHTFPKSGGYELISRRHALIQMMSGSSTLITDFSTNGIYAAGIAQMWRKPPGLISQTHMVRGGQVLYLAVDPGEIGAPESRGDHDRFRIEIVRFDATGASVRERSS